MILQRATSTVELGQTAWGLLWNDLERDEMRVSRVSLGRRKSQFRKAGFEAGDSLTVADRRRVHIHPLDDALCAREQQSREVPCVLQPLRAPTQADEHLVRQHGRLGIRGRHLVFTLGSDATPQGRADALAALDDPLGLLGYTTTMWLHEFV